MLLPNSSWGIVQKAVGVCSCVYSIMDKSRLCKQKLIMSDTTSPTNADWLLIAVRNKHPTPNVSFVVSILFSVPTTRHAPYLVQNSEHIQHSMKFK